MRNSAHTQGRAGFTLIEILVALILISLLVAAVFPVVTQQAGRAEAPRLASDLTSIHSGVELFNVNVRNRYPATLSQLTGPITATETGLGTLAYTDNHVSRWDGPYIDAAARDSLVSGFGAVISGSLAMFADSTNAIVTNPNQAQFVAVRIADLDSVSYARLNTLMDGDADTSAGAGYSAGKLRAIADTPEDAVYLAGPFRQ